MRQYTSKPSIVRRVYAGASKIVQSNLSGRIVSLEVQREREATCLECDKMVRDLLGNPHCSLCSCCVSGAYTPIFNLTRFEEQLPAQGCKHPLRSQGRGWVR